MIGSKSGPAMIACRVTVDVGGGALRSMSPEGGWDTIGQRRLSLRCGGLEAFTLHSDLRAKERQPIAMPSSTMPTPCETPKLVAEVSSSKMTAEKTMQKKK